MTRNLLLASLFLLAAALFASACDTPAKVARREVDRLNLITKTAEGEVAHSARVVMIDAATAEGHRRGKELKAAGCSVATATQPSTALVPPCKGIVSASEVRFDAATKQITDAQNKVVAVIDSVYAALKLVVDLLKTIDAGTKASGWEAKLVALVAKGASAYADVIAAIAQFKSTVAAFGGVK